MTVSEIVDLIRVQGPKLDFICEYDWGPPLTTSNEALM